MLNVAGTCDPELIENATQENYDKTMDIHLRGVFFGTKHGVIGTTKTAAIEAGPYNIRVNAVCPGVTHTEIMGAEVESQPDLVNKSVFKRVAEPREVSEIAAFLCSDRASWVHGQVVQPNGGMV